MRFLIGHTNQQTNKQTEITIKYTEEDTIQIQTNKPNLNKVVISVCLFVCLFFCLSDHNSETPGPICLKF